MITGLHMKESTVSIGGKCLKLHAFIDIVLVDRTCWISRRVTSITQLVEESSSVDL